MAVKKKNIDKINEFFIEKCRQIDSLKNVVMKISRNFVEEFFHWLNFSENFMTRLAVPVANGDKTFPKQIKQPEGEISQLTKECLLVF